MKDDPKRRKDKYNPYKLSYFKDEGKYIIQLKQNKTTIDRQFEYNTYIRDFFNDNKDKSLEQAIKCWKYKKSLKGHNKYEKDDLKILNS